MVIELMGYWLGVDGCLFWGCFRIKSQKSTVKVQRKHRLVVNEKVESMLQKKMYFCGRFGKKAKLLTVRAVHPIVVKN